MIEVKVKKLTESAIVPEFKTEQAACADLYADENRIVKPNETVVVSTGLAIQLPLHTQAKILGRSGLAVNHNIFVITGTIDADYRNEIGIILYNASKEDFIITKGDRIAQLDIMPTYKSIFTVVDELNTTDRKGGFGSTGV